MKFMTLQQNNQQKGMALIIAIGFMMILSILGAVVLRNATRDLGMSGSFMPARDAFYTADRAVEYAMNRDIIVNLTPGETIDLVDDDAVDENGAALPSGYKHHKIIENNRLDSSGNLLNPTSVSNNYLVAGLVSDLGPHDLPPSMSAIHGSEFGANLYHVEVKAETQSGLTSQVNSSIVRLYKMDDDTIFRTTGNENFSGGMLSH